MLVCSGCGEEIDSGLVKAGDVIFCTYAMENVRITETSA